MARQAAAGRRLAALLEHLADGYLVLDASGVVREAGWSSGRFWPGAEIPGVDAAALVHPDDAARLRHAVAAACERGRPVSHVDVRLGGPERARCPGEDPTPSRAECWLEVTLTNCFDDVSIGGVVASLRDVTDRKHGERGRRFAEERLRLGFEHGTAGMSITDTTGRILEVNPGVVRIAG